MNGALIFQSDEMALRKVSHGWSREDLLKQEGIFMLKDIVGLLEIDSTMIKRRYLNLVASGKNPYEVMGARKIWSHWMVRMTVFSGYYERHLTPLPKAPTTADANELLATEGIYRLSDVARLLPVTAQSLRHQAKRHTQSRKVMGVWKEELKREYFVDMSVFGPYFIGLWNERRTTPGQRILGRPYQEKARRRS